MVLLVAVGSLIGPSVMGLVENPLEGVGAQLVFTIGVSLILFHGGTGISLRVISRTAFGLRLLVLPGVFLTAVRVALAVATVFGAPLSVALMVGAVLAATDPAILIPLFTNIRLRPKVAQTVIAEFGFNDPVGTVFTLAVPGAVASGEVALSRPALEFVQSLFLGTLIGVVAGVALLYLVSTRRGGAWRESPAVAILAVVALGYFSVETLGSSGYPAAFVMG